MAYTEADRTIAFRHVEEGVRRIKAMRDSTAVAQRRGHPTTLPDLALATILRTLEDMEKHLVVIEASLLDHPDALLAARTGRLDGDAAG